MPIISFKSRCFLNILITSNKIVSEVFFISSTLTSLSSHDLGSITAEEFPDLTVFFICFVPPWEISIILPIQIIFILFNLFQKFLINFFLPIIFSCIQPAFFIFNFRFMFPYLFFKRAYSFLAQFLHMFSIFSHVLTCTYLFINIFIFSKKPIKHTIQNKKTYFKLSKNSKLINNSSIIHIINCFVIGQ